ncbi:uncharacterized protein LOC8277762 isoform X2 [Ricinus communis]|uniref:uncharacterized protein LOC8277762 isoform X2 n=1 Tax=Ricinus communis TaxID=3988 RepID=UPI00201A56A7|nr:uncharacterized protein LOC8277762 isoform X2 [Ricinus communis]
MMGNIIKSFTSGFTNTISDLFTSPLDFLSGKSCSSVCGSTWDFVCYIENFCVANLLKLAMVLALLYIVLLLIYLLYKLRIFECVGHSLCKLAWACMVCWISLWKNCCFFLRDSLIMLKRVSHHHRRDSSEFDTSEDDCYDYEHRTMDVSSRPLSRQMMDYRTAHLRRSLRPKSHRIRVGLSTGSEHGYGRYHHIKHANHGSTVNNIRVIQSSKFVRKGINHRRKGHSRERW